MLLENDANLAALGDRWRGAAAGVDDLVVLLAGERLGAGVIESGRLLHGRGGAAGEMGSWTWWKGSATPSASRPWRGSGPRPAGKAARSAGAPRRRPAASSRTRPRETPRPDDPGPAGRGDGRSSAPIATLINPEQVVIGGAVADSAGALLPAIAAPLPNFTATPPRVTVSPLGDTIVTVGAVRHALDYVEANALELELTRPAA